MSTVFTHSMTELFCEKGIHSAQRRLHLQEQVAAEDREGSLPGRAQQEQKCGGAGVCVVGVGVGG